MNSKNNVHTLTRVWRLIRTFHREVEPVSALSPSFVPARMTCSSSSIFNKISMAGGDNIARYSTTPPVYSNDATASSSKSKEEQLSPEESGKYKVFTIPNVLCVARIGATPIIGYLVVQHKFCPAFGLFIIAGFTDLLDGLIARNVAGQKSLLGSVLDPVADKLLISTMFITMTYSGLLPLPLTLVVILRDVCLIIGGFYKRYKTMDPPYSLNRFFNPEVSSMQVVPTLMSKVNTVLQLSVVASALASPVFQFGDLGQTAITGLCWTTAMTTIYSGLQYTSGKAIKKA